MLLYDTRSTRDHAEQKASSRRTPARHRTSVTIAAVVGLVVQPCGEDIFRFSIQVGLVSSGRHTSMSSSVLHLIQTGRPHLVGLRIETAQILDVPHAARDCPHITYLSVGIIVGRNRFCTDCVVARKLTE